MKIAIGSDVDFDITGLIDGRTDTYLNSATVTFSLKDFDGGILVGPTAAAYVAASDGDYLGSFAAAFTATLDEGAEYFLEMTATQGGLIIFRREPVIAYYP